MFATPPWLADAKAAAYWTYRSCEQGHGRLETRTLEASTALNGWRNWPGGGHVLRRTCERVTITTGEVAQETTSAVTSLTHEQASADHLQRSWRGHWGIENRLYYVRDVTMGEDAGQTHQGSAPQALAALRNACIGLLRQTGWKNIAAALRHDDAHPLHTLSLIGALPARL